MNWFFRFLEKHPKGVIAVILLITVFMLYFAFGIGMNASYGAFMPVGEDTDTFQGGVSGQTPVTGVERRVKTTPVAPIDSYDTPSDETEDAEPAPAVEETVVVDENADLPYTATYLLLVGGDDIFSVDNLNLLEETLNGFSAFRDVGEPYSVFDYFTFWFPELPFVPRTGFIPSAYSNPHFPAWTYSRV